MDKTEITPNKFKFTHLIALTGGAILPPLLWELVHLVVLTRIAGFELYLRNADQRFKFILDDGSGVGLRTHAGAEFFRDKFFLLSEISHPQRWVTAIIFLAIFVGGLILLRLWHSESEKQNLLAPFWLGWLANTIWFVTLAKTGWTRHFWFGLVLAVMLLCVMIITLIRYGLSKNERREFRLPPKISLAGGVLLLLLIGWGFVSQPHVWGLTLPAEIVPYWQSKQINNKYGAGLPWIIIPRDAQAEIVEKLKQLPPEANIYYPAQHKTAELPAQTGKIFYPLRRRTLMTPHPQDVVIIGPSLTSPWMEPARREALLELVKNDCPQPLLANDFYMICPFPAQ